MVNQSKYANYLPNKVHTTYENLFNFVATIVTNYNVILNMILKLD